MTFNEIGKEFDEKFTYLGRNQIDQQEILIKPYTTPDKIKSFLKQSFIKYLEGEVDRLEESKRVIIICSDTSIEKDIACRSCSEGYSSCDNAQTDFVYNQAISDQITHLQALLIAYGN